MVEILNKIPPASKNYINNLIESNNIRINLKKNRKTKHGDFSVKKNGFKLITINSDLNSYRFLITLIHEISHFLVYKDYGSVVKPHGIEWKNKFKKLLLPVINLDVFPKDILKFLAIYAINPKASTDADLNLSIVLNKYNSHKSIYVLDLINGSVFKAFNGKQYKLIKKLRKRYECLELSTNKVYLFSPNVKILEVVNGE
tara:strand:+ start:191 stop:790 length:600 start_codon:yes stop_codon:yes gene_type:complete